MTDFVIFANEVLHIINVYSDMIPRVIHYCWFGGNPIPDKLKRCIGSWERLMPDYEIVCWDESNFDVHSLPFTAEAYSRRKWAFVSDYVRLYALYHHGGVYLDTDVVAYKRFDPFLGNHAFSSVESYFYRDGDVDDFRIEACVIGAERNNAFIGDCLGLYSDAYFLLPDGSCDEKVINLKIAEVAESRYGLRRGVFSPSPIHLAGDVLTLYPPHVFTHFKGAINGDSVAMHLYEGSWRDKQEVRSRVIKSVDDAMEKVLGLRRWSLMRWAVRRRYLKLRDGSRSAL